MKRNLFVLSLMIFALVFSLVSCNKEETSNKEIINLEEKEYEGEYDRWNANFQEEYVRKNCNVSCDNIVIDGKIDEDDWNKLGWQEYTQYGITVKFTLTYNENGIFWAMDSSDTNIHFNVVNYPEGNTSFEVLVAPYELESNVPKTEMLQTRQDLSAYAMTLVGRNIRGEWDWQKSQELVFHKWTLKGENAILFNGVSEACEGWQSEGFIDWSSIGVDIEADGVPEKLRIYTQYNYQDSLNKSTRVDYIRPQAFYDQSRSWYIYDQNGFIAGDNRIEEENEGVEILIGDGICDNGILGKTSGWDLSEAASGVIKMSKAFDTQWIYFKDVNATDYVISATIKATGAYYGASDARLGLIAGMRENLNSYSPFNALVVGVGSKVSGKVSYINYNYKFTKNTWSEQLGPTGVQIASDVWTKLGDAYGNTTLDGDATVNLKIIKRGSVLVYMVNNKLWEIVTNDNIAENAVPGLYAYNCEGEFTDLYCSTNEEDINNAMSEVGLYSININTTGNGNILGQVYDGATPFGAKFSTSMLAKEGNSVEISAYGITSAIRASILKSLKVNGEEVELTNGVYKITSVSGNITIDAEFENATEYKQVSIKSGSSESVNVTIYQANDDFSNYGVIYENQIASSEAQFRLGYGYYKIVIGTNAKYINVCESGIYELDSDGNPIGSDPISSVSFE